MTTMTRTLLPQRLCLSSPPAALSASSLVPGELT